MFIMAVKVLLHHCISVISMQHGPVVHAQCTRINVNVTDLLRWVVEELRLLKICVSMFHIGFRYTNRQTLLLLSNLRHWTEHYTARAVTWQLNPQISHFLQRLDIAIWSICAPDTIINYWSHGHRGHDDPHRDCQYTQSYPMLMGTLNKLSTLITVSGWSPRSQGAIKPRRTTKGASVENKIGSVEKLESWGHWCQRTNIVLSRWILFQDCDDELKRRTFTMYMHSQG